MPDEDNNFGGSQFRIFENDDVTCNLRIREATWLSVESRHRMEQFKSANVRKKETEV